MKNNLGSVLRGFCGAVLLIVVGARAEEHVVSKACIDGTEPGWRDLEQKEFVQVNCDPETFTWTNGLIHCTGKPMGVLRTDKIYKNFELVAQWRHLEYGGNSGIYVWTTPESIKALEKRPAHPFPSGIEIQVLDHGFKEMWEKEHKKKADWFTTNGDVFPTETNSMVPFPPFAPHSQRSFPRKNLSKGIGEWNHYYIRCMNGEVRLWVNGEEVSGGNNAKPATGYICLESEGAPIDFKNLRIRELP